MSYRNVEELGRGGFGVVHRCVRQADGVSFARKTLLLDDGGSIKRFQREVRIIQKLRHPKIITIVSANLDTHPYSYVMPHYALSLAALIPSLQGDAERALRIFDRVLEAIEYAHGANVIHRDLKPENVLMSDDDQPVVTDFGLGRALDAMTSRATGTGAMIGTYGYMAPEQMYGAELADPRSDIFSLGRMLYEMLTGDSRLAVQDCTKLPVGLAELVQKCTQTDRNLRFQSVTELRGALARITQREPQAAPSLQALIEKIAGKTSFGPGEIDELAKLIGLCREEPELLHDVVIKISAPAFAQLDAQFPEISSLLAKQFAAWVMGKGWDFAYTDTIGSACAKLYDATRQAEIKGLMTAAALEVGVSHNRFYVMDVAANLIASAKADDVALAVAHAIRGLDYAAVQSRLTVWKLHPALLELYSAAGPKDS